MESALADQDKAGDSVRAVDRALDILLAFKGVDGGLTAAELVKRKKFGTIPLDEIPPDRRKGYPSGAWDLVPIAALYWCDGRRNLAEVKRLTQLELGATDFDFVAYFRFLRKHAYVNLVE